MDIQATFNRIRQAELECVREYFQPHAKVLEIGGGSGFQAGLIAASGADIVSVDLSGRAGPATQHFPVQDYDGETLPFSDRSLDVVFSSNVLEHVEPISALLAEIRRVLKPDGLAVHLIPSPAWRFWTLVSHYPYGIKVLFSGHAAIPGVNEPPDPGEMARKKGWMYVIRRILFPRAHGNFRNALTELYTFRMSWWVRHFHESHFKVHKVFSNGVFYTGYGIFPGMSIETRRRLARVLGGACHVYVMSPG